MMTKRIQLLLLLACLFPLHLLADDNRLSYIEFWIDNDRTFKGTVDATQFIIDGSSLSEGLHTLNYRAIDSRGNSSALHTWMFCRIKKQTVGSAKLEYWTDEDAHKTREVKDSTVSFAIDASALSEGLHTLYYRLTAEGSTSSAVHSWMFYRTSLKPRATKIKSYRIWWNDHQDKAVEVALADVSTEVFYEETLAVPEYARNDGYSQDYTARFHIMFIDDQGGHSSVETGVVSYPDVYPPSTTLTAERTAGTDKVVLRWTSNKQNVQSYNVYYSENGEPYLLWQSGITNREATFTGQHGTNYRFVVTACDDKGNYEAIEERKAAKVELR